MTPKELNILEFELQNKFDFLLLLPSFIFSELTNKFLKSVADCERFVWRWNIDEIKLRHSQIFADCDSSWIPTVKNVWCCVTNCWEILNFKVIFVFLKLSHRSHEPSFNGHLWTSIGKFSKFMGQAEQDTSKSNMKIRWLFCSNSPALIVNLYRKIQNEFNQPSIMSIDYLLE